MKAEKIILSFIAILVGLIAAGVAFYLYQMTKNVPISKTKTVTVSITPSPSPEKSNFISLDSPHDEEVFDKNEITVSGKTAPDTTIIISTEDTDQVIKSTANGDFSTTQTLPLGTTLLQVTAIFADGTEKKLTQTITYSTENF